MGQSDFNQDASQNSTAYYEIRDGGVFLSDRVYTNGNVFLYCSGNCQVMPLSAQPGQSFDALFSLNDTVTYQQHTTFVGTETLTLAGKVFSNVCHLRLHSTMPAAPGIYTDADEWYAPGYGLIKATGSNTGMTVPTQQYNGDL
ncbi:MAG: hypothetical protein FWD77_07220 [Betaproteobacteria bacterium]|nr:hypothetical protein [Betaproteobacteria bacterium]